MSTSKVEIKIQDPNFTRKLVLPSLPSWLELSGLVKERFNLDGETAFILSYTDEDGDLIAVVSNLFHIILVGREVWFYSEWRVK